MKHILQQHFGIATHLVILTIAVCVGASVAYTHTQSVNESLTQLVEKQADRIVELAIITDRNGADEETASILSDCPRREDYEGYLVRLATLTKQELVSMQNLFEACSPFYTEQKKLMVSKLTRELESYQSYIALLDTLTDVDAYKEAEARFVRLVEIESERSSLIVDQTELQAKIISLLISGKSVNGAEVATLLTEAGQVSELLGVTDRQADEIRTHFEK